MPLLRPIWLLLLCVFALGACGGSDSKKDDPAPPQNVQVVVTAVNAGQATTLGGRVYFGVDAQSFTFFDIEQNQQKTHDEPNLKTGQFIDVELAFTNITSPRRILGNTSITAEVLVNGVSKRRFTLDAATTTYNSSGAISTTQRVQL